MSISLQSSTTVMRVAFGLMATLAGLDKFFHILVDWDRYLSPFAAQMLPVSPSVFMGAVGIIEIVVGVAILTVLPSVGAYVASVWLLLIAGNLVLGGHFDIAVRDAVLSISAFSLARYLDALGHSEAERRPAAPEGRPLRA